MATIGDYVVLSDSQVVLHSGGDIDHDFPFSIPNNIDKDQQSILTLQFQADSNPNNLQWKMNVNGTQVASFTHNAFVFTAIQEVFGSGILNTGANNKVTVTVLGGTGNVKVSDMVIHFQANV
jgi:hypothetical protein